MNLAIIILSYLWFFNDFMDSISDEHNNLLFSGALMVLVSWQVSAAWGICMIVVALLVLLNYFSIK